MEPTAEDLNESDPKMLPGSDPQMTDPQMLAAINNVVVSLRDLSTFKKIKVSLAALILSIE